MTPTQNKLGIEFISVLGLSPVSFIELAATLQCHHIGMALAPFTANPHSYPLWSLRDNPALRRETIVAMQDNDVSISLGEGFIGLPGRSLADSASDLDIMCGLGVSRVNVVSCDPDLGRAYDELALFAEIAGERGLEATLEFVPGLAIGNLSASLAAIRHVGRANFRLLADLMHLFRSGTSVAELAELDSTQVGYIQLCDVPLVSKFAHYGEEARDERLPLGEGELPLEAALAALPRDLIVGIEAPMVKKAASGVPPYERLAGSVATARALLAGIERKESAGP
jgi:sugar phosphate isomerase/epimerase